MFISSFLPEFSKIFTPTHLKNLVFKMENHRNVYISVDIISVDMQTMTLKTRDYAEQRSPTLNTVLMVEDTLQKAAGLMSVAELKRKLPKQVMHQTVIAILDYLAYSGKIVFSDDKVLWTFNPKSQLKKIKGLDVR